MDRAVIKKCQQRKDKRQDQKYPVPCQAPGEASFRLRNRPYFDKAYYLTIPFLNFILSTVRHFQFINVAAASRHKGQIGLFQRDIVDHA